jgi:cell division protein FtsB
MIYSSPKKLENRHFKTEIWKATKQLLAQLLDLDINEQLANEIDYLKTENQVLKNQIAQSGKRIKFTDGQRRFLAIKAKKTTSKPVSCICQ